MLDVHADEESDPTADDEEHLGCVPVFVININYMRAHPCLS